jgi:hypothetical protein
VDKARKHSRGCGEKQCSVHVKKHETSQNAKHEAWRNASSQDFRLKRATATAGNKQDGVQPQTKADENNRTAKILKT